MMKVVLSSVLVLCLAFYSNAQANHFLVFGNLAYSNVKSSSNNKTKKLVLNPGFGYQFSEHSAVGIEGTFGNYKEEFVNSIVEYKEYSIGAFYRYIYNLNKMFSVYSHLGVGLLDNSTSTSGFYVKANPAIALRIDRSMCITFNTGQLIFQKAGETSAFEFQYGLPQLGVLFNFGPKPAEKE